MALTVDIEKKVGDFTLKVAFHAENGVHGLLGASGCGKSMTLRCIAGVEKPDRGRIEVDGRVLFDSERKIDLPPRERRVGLLFQEGALFPNMTVEGNLKTALRGRDRHEGKKELDAMLRRFALEGLEKHRPSQLSGGQKQRAALARIMLTKPALLLLDEPLTALDSYLRWQLELELSELLEEFEGTALLVTHNRDEVQRLCSAVTVLEQGYGQGALATETLFRAPDTLSACLLSGCKNISRTERLGPHRILAVDWGTELTCAAAVGAEITHVGVRAHYLTLTEEEGENTIPCTVERVVENLFSTVVMCATPGGRKGFSRLRLELPRAAWEAWGGKRTLFLRIDPSDLMLLRHFSGETPRGTRPT